MNQCLDPYGIVFYHVILTFTFILFYDWSCETPTVKPISEIQRNMAAIAWECRETKAPIYLTKNGSASLVVMDAEAFDREMSLHQAVLEREERVFREIMRGREDELSGRVRSLEDARRDDSALREVL